MMIVKMLSYSRSYNVHSLVALIVVLDIVSIHTSCAVNSRSLAYNESDVSGNFSNNGGVQFLFSSLNFTEEGYVTEWSAAVTGNTSIDGLIEFQIFEPDAEDKDVYHLVYHNSYQGNNANGSVIKRPVEFLSPFIPIRPGYTVGVYLPPRVVDELGILYATTGNDDNNDTVYYWEDINNRTCSYQLCTGRIMNGIQLYIGWTFQASLLETIQGPLDLLKQGILSYCHYLPLAGCTVNASNLSVPSDVSPSTGTVSSIIPSLYASSLPDVVPSSSIDVVSPSPSIGVSSTGTDPPLTTTGTTPPPSSSSTVFAPELIAAFSVVLLLLLIVLLLIIGIGVCCCIRRKPIIQSPPAQGFDNPDYNGVISSDGGKKQPTVQSVELADISRLDPLSTTNPVITTTVPTGSPIPQFDDTHYYSTAGLQNTMETPGPKTPSPRSPPVINNDIKVPTKPRNASSSSNHIPPPSVLTSTDNNTLPLTEHTIDSNTEPSPLEPSHYYSSPTTDVSNLSFPISGGVYDTVNENGVPSTRDPEVMYDEANVTVDKNKKSTSKDNNSAYAYVPTSEQRKLLDWRYELPMDTAYNKLTFFEEQNKFWAPATTASGLYEQLATNKYREIPRECINVTSELGQGQFGSVSKGVWASPDGRHEVAIKMLKPNATEDDRLKLLQEAAIMGQFCNKNVVKVQGVVTVGDPIMLVLEFMPRGDLRSYLRSIVSVPRHGRWTPHPNLPKLLLKLCRDIASGMRYLAGKSFVHRDLAARNILLSKDLTCKIGDFGMARDLMQDEGNYYTSSGGIIPIKWTAPEALNFRKYSTDSDVWSYGMVLFEIWSLGRKPFSELSNPIVIALINSKHCQAPPPGCPRPIYQLMVDCWHPEHSERPPFTKIVKHLDSSSDILLGWNKEDNIRGKNAHILGAPLEDSSDLYVDLQRVYQQSMLQNYNGNRQRSRSNY